MKRWVAGLLVVYCCFPVEISKAADIWASDFGQLINALDGASPGDTILLEDGTYQISGTWAVAVTTPDITIRGASGKRENVIINGMGMVATEHHGFWISAHHVTIMDLTVQNVRNHCIQTDTNVDNLTVSNCILRDAGEQILKVPSNSGIPDPSESGIVENCLFEYSAGVGPQYYIGGIDVHFGRNWIVRDNTFRFIRSPGGSLAEHAIHFWSDSEGTLVERNRIITCDRGIGFGLGSSGHSGGVIRNNMIYHDGTPGFNDVGIGLENASNVTVCNNTIFSRASYSNGIEYRFPGTTAEIRNNLTNKAIVRRDGGEADLLGNLTTALESWFVDPVNGDLHLAYQVGNVVDQGQFSVDVQDDFDGQLRPLGAAMDIGADEYGFCSPDDDLDGDVDGIDLVRFTGNDQSPCIVEFAAAFGR